MQGPDRRSGRICLPTGSDWPRWRPGRAGIWSWHYGSIWAVVSPTGPVGPHFKRVDIKEERDYYAKNNKLQLNKCNHCDPKLPRSQGPMALRNLGCPVCHESPPLTAGESWPERVDQAVPKTSRQRGEIIEDSQLRRQWQRETPWLSGIPPSGLHLLPMQRGTDGDRSSRGRREPDGRVRRESGRSRNKRTEQAG